MSDYHVRWLEPREARKLLGQTAGDGKGWCRLTGGPVPALLRLGRTGDGRMACTGVAFVGEGEELTARMVREMPLGELVSVAAGQQSGEGAVGDFMRSVIAELAGEAPTRTRPGPRGYPPEHYQLVADAYRAALRDSPRSPVQSLAAHLHVSEPTVRRWVQKARDRRLLGPSMPGRAGEQPIDDQEAKR